MSATGTAFNPSSSHIKLTLVPMPRLSMQSSPMRTSYLRPVVLLTLAAFTMPAAASWQRDAAVKIEAEVDLLRKSLAAKPDSDPQWKEAKAAIGRTLDQAADELRGGRLYVSLERISGALVSFRGLERAGGKTDDELLNQGLPGIETEIKKARVELARSIQESRPDSSANVSLVIRALTEKAQGEAADLIEGGRGFALLTGSAADRVNNFSSALYYVGNSEGQSEAIAFYRSLNLPRTGAPSPFLLRSVSPELGCLQDQTTAAFKPPRSVEQHSDFIRLNATLKQAGELDAAHLYAGALYQYLDAVQQFEKLGSPAPDVQRQSKLKADVQEMHARLRASKQDSSLAQLFLERAESRLAKSPSEDDWKAVQAIVEHVLPAYFAMSKPAPVRDQPALARVTVTLVRWPYT
jgi:hypothetical protein